MKERWIALKSANADLDALSKRFGVSKLLIKLILNRGVDESEIGNYLYGTMDDLSDATMMKDLKVAADIILGLAGNGERIAIVSDYDCDGVFSGMILYTGLKKLGLDPYIYTPDRVTEGYGINMRIVDEIYESGIRNIITCDNGIAAYDEVKHAKELGMTVIITDHHEIPYREDASQKMYIIPEADAVLDPKQEDCGYVYDSLCGAGVAYRLIDYLYDVVSNNADRNHRIEITRVDRDILVQYAAIATVADVMDLTGENRVIVREGLKLLSETDNIGLKAIKEATGIDNEKLGTYHIGFIIGPCFNAAGRIKNAKIAFDLLMCDDEEKASEYAEILNDLNDQRKIMTEEAADYCMSLANEGKFDNDSVVLIHVPDCHESVVGIVAGRIKERLCKPVIVFTDGEGGMYKGSGRSIESYNMFEELSRCRDLFEKFGGHAMAAGITMKGDHFDELARRLDANSNLTEEDFTAKVEIDAQLLFRHINTRMVEELDILEPCGKANNRPLFANLHAKVKGARVVGRDDNIVKLYLVDSEGCEADAVLFYKKEELFDMIRTDFGEEELNNMLSWKPNNIDIAITFQPKINEYRGNRNVELVIQNFNRII